MWKIGLLALAGAVGTVARYGLVTWTQRFSTSGFPWGTLTVNLLGCFLFGLVVKLTAGKWLSAEAQLILLTGFMGAFTTFSSFAYDNVVLLQTGRYLEAGVNIIGQNVAGIVLLFLGAWVGACLIKWLG